MNYYKMAKILKLNDDSYVWQKYWEASQSVYPGKDIFFLQQSYLDKMNKLLKLPDVAITQACGFADFAKNHEALSRLVWHCYFVLFRLSDYMREDLEKWPSLINFCQGAADMFPAVIAIAGIPKMQQIYQDMKMPQNVLVDTLDFLRVWMEDYYKKNGRWGFSKLTWFIFHQLSGKLFRLGRLEYEPALFKGDIKVYQNKKSKKVIAFAESGVQYRSDGQVNGTSNIFDEKGAWISQLTEDENIITGNPIHPDGYALNRNISINAKESELVLEKGNSVLSIHIPATGKLTPDITKESYALAAIFFKKYFSQKTFSAFYCGTWFLDSQLKSMLPEDSNILKFQKDFYLYPTLTDDMAMFNWVFGGKPDDLFILPKQTRLQKAILSNYEQGRKMHSGTGFKLIRGVRGTGD